jgi:hypothetical protein
MSESSIHRASLVPGALILQADWMLTVQYIITLAALAANPKQMCLKPIDMFRGRRVFSSER